MAPYRWIAAILMFCAGVASASTPVVAVLDFATEGVSAGEMRSIVDLLGSALYRTGRFSVIDAGKRDALLREIEFAASPCSEEGCGIEIGRLLAAERVVVGSLGRVGSRFVISAKLIETATGRTMGVADGVYASVESILDTMDRFAAALARPTASGSSARRAGGVGCLAAAVGGTVAAAYLGYRSVAAYRGPLADAWTAYDKAPAGADFDGLYETYRARYRTFGAFALAAGAATAGGIGLTIAGAALLASSGAPRAAVVLRPVIELDRVGLAVSVGTRGGSR